jgi:putative CocE/NonD family hydrolase
VLTALTSAATVSLLPARAAAPTMVTRELSFTADDGVVLHATIGGADTIIRRPLIIEDSPYAPGCCNAFAGPSYNYIEMDWRGTGRSGGTWSTTGARDQQDLSEFVGWACHQSWSDGRIGLYGFSASAIIAYNSMHLPMPCVNAAALMAGGVDLYRDLFYIGGVPNGGPGLVVFGSIAGAWTGELPLRVQQQPASIPAGVQGYVAAAPTVAQNPTEDAYWQDRTFKGDLDHIPILADTSFYDVEPRGPFLAYRATRQYGSHLLVLGAHDGFPPGLSPFPQYARWFDHYVRGIDNGIDRESPVDVYLSNGSQPQLLAGHYTHLTGSDWPLPATRWDRLYLSSPKSGTAKSLNDGTLALSASQPSASQSYPFTPSDPLATDPHTTATIGASGNGSLSFNQLFNSVPALTRMDLVEPTALTYTTAPLHSAMNVAGPASVDVFAASTASETDLVAVIADVWPDGTAHPVGAGQLRTSFPGVDVARSLVDPQTGDIVDPYNDFATKTPDRIGVSREYHIEILPIGNHFDVGHRIRLYLVGTSGYMLPSAIPAINTVFVGGLTPSRLLLPVAGG